jgi:hypothetical protein
MAIDWDSPTPQWWPYQVRTARRLRAVQEHLAAARHCFRRAVVLGRADILHTPGEVKDHLDRWEAGRARQEAEMMSGVRPEVTPSSRADW